jgi:hypothetical protein
MSIAQEIAKSNTAAIEAQAAVDKVHQRVRTSALIINTVLRKSFPDDTKPSSLEWIDAFFKRDSTIVHNVDNADASLSIVSEGKTFPIANKFIFGSMWDITRATRQEMYEYRYACIMQTQRTSARAVRIAENGLQQEIDNINKQAQRKIREAEREARRQSEQGARELELAERRLANIDRYRNRRTKDRSSQVKIDA